MPFPLYYVLLLSARIDNDHLFKYTILKNKLYVRKHWRSLSEEEKKNTQSGQWENKRS